MAQIYFALDIVNDYLNANVTVGVKGPNKIEYSIKAGMSQSENSGTNTQKVSNNVEFKIKKSYELSSSVSPYVSLRLGQKIKDNGNNFSHSSVDAGVKFKLMEKLSFDTGLRYRNALNNVEFRKAEGASAEDHTYQSLRAHGTLLLDLDKANTIGLRYTKSDAEYYKEERDGWRVHYQHNY